MTDAPDSSSNVATSGATAGGATGSGEGDKGLRIFDALPDATFVTDAEGRIVEANPAACRMAGRTRDVLVTQCLADVVVDAVAPRSQAIHTPVAWLDSQEALAMAAAMKAASDAGLMDDPCAPARDMPSGATEMAATVSWRCRCATSGEIRVIEARLARIAVGAAPAGARVVVCCRDVTEHARFDARQSGDLQSSMRTIDELLTRVDELRADRKTLQTFVATVPGFVWSGEPDGAIDFLNQRWLDFTGMRHEDACGWGWMVAVHPDDIDGLVGYWRSILAAGRPGEIEARLRCRDGSFHWFLFRGEPIRDGAGNVVKWHGTTTHIEGIRSGERWIGGRPIEPPSDALDFGANI